MKRKINVAFIGAVGVPNNYGGFEMFLESCAPHLLKDFNQVYITCDSAKYKSKEKYWNGVNRVFIPISANGALSVIHDLFAYFSVFWRTQVIVVLGVSGGIFFPFFWLLSTILGKKLIVNVDGVEWRRAKFSKTMRLFLYMSDRLAQICAHKIIVDNSALRPYLVTSRQESAALIAYPGDHIIRTKPNIDKNIDLHCLTICRIEPENNCHVLIESFARAGRGRYVFVGNWNSSDYGIELRKRYASVEGLEMLDPIYDKDTLASLRESCNLYLHGHSVGGTNPSLVEMLFYDCSIIAFDCSFNRVTADDSISYFKDEDQLAKCILQFKYEHIVLSHIRRFVIRLRYTRLKICRQYVQLICGLVYKNEYNPPIGTLDGEEFMVYTLYNEYLKLAQDPIYQKTGNEIIDNYNLISDIYEESYK